MQNMNGQGDNRQPSAVWVQVPDAPTPPPVDHTLQLKKELKATSNKAAAGVLMFYGFSLIIQSAISLLTEFFRAQGEAAFNNYADFMNDPNFGLIFNSFCQLLFMTIPFIISAKISGAKIPKILNYGKPIKGTLLPIGFMGLGGAMMCNLANSIIMIFLSAFGITPSGGNIEMEISLRSFLLNILCVAVVPALFEEFAFRGIMMGLLSRKFSVQTSIIISAAAFSLIHGNFVQIPFTFLMGLILGYSYAITKSMWVPMLIHFLNNAYSVTVDHLTWGMPSTTAGIVLYATMILLIIIGLISFGIAAKRTPEIFTFKKEESAISQHKMLKLGFLSPVMIVACSLYLLKALGVQLSI